MSARQAHLLAREQLLRASTTLQLEQVVRRAETSVRCDVEDARSYSKRLREMRQKMPEGYQYWRDDGYRYLEERKRAALRAARIAQWILTGRWARRYYGKAGIR